MSGQLAHRDDGPPVARCFRCGAVAAGPCARCRQPVCGDCCVLTEGGAKVWAICLGCEDKSGKSLGSAWRGFVVWLLTPIVLLAVVVFLLETRCR